MTKVGAPFRWVSATRQGIALILAVFSLYAAYFGAFSDMIQRSFHLALVAHWRTVKAACLAFLSICF